MLSSVLASRLNNIMGSYIHMDQSDFLKNRHVVKDIRRMMAINYIHKAKSVSIFYFLNVERAFDKVEWCFLKYVL